jgi:hypothetical protein
MRVAVASARFKSDKEPVQATKPGICRAKTVGRQRPEVDLTMTKNSPFENHRVLQQPAKQKL